MKFVLLYSIYAIVFSLINGIIITAISEFLNVQIEGKHFAKSLYLASCMVMGGLFTALTAWIVYNAI